MSFVGDVLKLTTLPQKLLLGGLGASLVAVSGFSVYQAIEVRILTAQVSKLDKSINDPKTGYTVMLRQAETNTDTLKGAVAERDRKIKDQAAKDNVIIANVQTRYDAEHKARVLAERQVGAFLAHKPEGATPEARMLDVDRQILEDLK